MSKVTIYITLATSIVAWLALSAWTVRRLWKGWSNDYQRMVYRFGVRFFGIGGWILFGILLPLTQPDNLIPSALSAALTLFIGFPIFLWAGYVWGLCMARFYGLSE